MKKSWIKRCYLKKKKQKTLRLYPLDLSFVFFTWRGYGAKTISRMTHHKSAVYV